MILFDEPELVRAWLERVGEFVNVFFLPVFFTCTGLRTSIGSLSTLQDWQWCALILVAATVGKLGAAYVAARSCAATCRVPALRSPEDRAHRGKAARL